MNLFDHCPVCAQPIAQCECSPEAHARNTDPDTSHEAAASVTSIRIRQLAILETLQRAGEGNDEWISDHYRGPEQSPSGLRTRRSELVRAGLVKWTGKKMKTRAGRASRVWQAVER